MNTNHLLCFTSCHRKAVSFFERRTLTEKTNMFNKKGTRLLDFRSKFTHELNFLFLSLSTGAELSLKEWSVAQQGQAKQGRISRTDV